MKIKIGTRKSRLAIAQTEMVISEISRLFPDIETEIVYISTKGDKIIDKPLAELGGKGIFVSEIERALQSGAIDIAVHSAKDLPVELADGLEISGVLERGSYNDVLVTRKNRPIAQHGDFIVGTGSLRRRMSLSSIYTGLRFANIRGNVDTRLRKLLDGEYDGIVLALAGLERLNLFGDESFDYRVFGYREFIPAPCQGIIAVESRAEDNVTPIINAINNQSTYLSFETERYIIEQLGAGCDMPLGAYSFVENGNITIIVSNGENPYVTDTDSADNRFKLAGELMLCL